MSSRNHQSIKQLWVMPHPEGWQLKHAGKSKAALVTETKVEAVALAREMAKHGHDELIIKGKDNLIQSKDSHGNDPIKIQG